MDSGIFAQFFCHLYTREEIGNTTSFDSFISNCKVCRKWSEKLQWQNPFISLLTHTEKMLSRNCEMEYALMIKFHWETNQKNLVSEIGIKFPKCSPI